MPFMMILGWICRRCAYRWRPHSGDPDNPPTIRYCPNCNTEELICVTP